MELFDKPILITGPMRTGTTALMRALNFDPRVCFWYEGRLYDPKHDFHHTITYQIKRKRWPLPSSVIFDAERIVYELDKRYNCGANVIRDFLFRRATGDAKLVAYGDKMPRVYLQHAKKIFEQWPNAKFIVCIRDGRDVTRSAMRFFKHHGNRAMKNWLESMLHWEEAKSSLPPEKYFELRYENPDMCGLMNFCGIDNTKTTAYFKPRRVGFWREEPELFKADFVPEGFHECLKRWGYSK